MLRFVALTGAALALSLLAPEEWRRPLIGLAAAIPLAIYDFREHRIPEWILWPALSALSIIAVVVQHAWIALAISLAATTFAFALYLVSGAFGFGDVGILALALLSLSGTGAQPERYPILCIVIAFLSALTIRLAKKEQLIPYGTAIATGTTLSIGVMWLNK